MSDVWLYLLLGLGTASAYAIAAQGMVAVHRGSGLVNFAGTAFALVGAWVYFEAEGSMPRLPAALLGIAAAALLGGLTYVSVMRGLSHAAPLNRVIATLGVAIVGQAAMGLLIGQDSKFPAALFADDKVSVLGASVSRYYLIMFGIALVLTAVLSVVYRYTLFGLQTSAVAENRRASAALGRSPEMVGILNWTIGAALAGLAGILVTPLIGLSVVTLPLLLLPTLAAGLLGNFNSFWLALLGGLVVGIGESELTRYDIGQGWPQSVGFIVVLIVLIVRRNALPSRGTVQARLPSVGLGIVRLRPAIVAVVLACVAALLLGGGTAGALATSVGIGIVLLSTVVVTGYAGQISLAQLGLAGVGALIAARLAETQDLSMWAVLPLGVLGTLPIGAIVGLPALRTRGVNLAIVTLGLALVIEEVVLSNSKYTGGLIGTTVTSPSFFGLDLDATSHPQRYAVFVILVFALCAWLVANLRRGRVGRQLIAVRGNERAAAAIGISLTASKLYAFVVGAGLAAVGGVLLAYQSTAVVFTQFGTVTSISLLSFIVVAGIGYIPGGFVGGALATGGLLAYILNEVFHGSHVNDWLTLASGLGVLVVVTRQPDGVAGAIAQQLHAVLVRRRPEEPGPAGPSSHGGHATARRHDIGELSVEGLGKRFGGVVALDDVSFTVRSGEILGLIGPNGAGKTTAIDAISGLTRGYTGRVMLDREPVDALSPARRARRGIGRSFQALELFEDLSVEDHLRVASDVPRRRNYLTDLLRPGRRPLPEPARAAISEFDLDGVLDRKPAELSYGQRRLVGIARAVAAMPAVLLLDEPAAGLDDRETRELAHLLDRLASEWNFAIVLVEHDMTLVMDVCDRLAVLDFGRVIAEGRPEDVARDNTVVEAYLGKPAAHESSRSSLEVQS